MRCGSGRGWGGGGVGEGGRRAGLRQKSRRGWRGQMLLVGVVGEEGELQGGGGREPTSKTARQGPMPLNEMTVGKVEWGVEALEAWGGPGVDGRVSLADRQDSPNQVATKQPKSWTRTLPFLNHDGTVDDQAMATRESGGRRAARSVEAATTAAGCGAQWGVFWGGRAGSFGGAEERQTREMEGVQVFGLWCSGAADGAAVATRELGRGRETREKRGSSSSPVAGEREPSGFWNYYERGARWDGTGGFNLKGGPGRRRRQQRARPLRTDLQRCAGHDGPRPSDGCAC